MINQIKPVIGKISKIKAINYIKSDAWLTEHKLTEEFEKKFAKFTNSKYCITFPNGTLTMSSILDCLDIGKNDEVLVSNYTMVATANVAHMVKASPVLVDISKHDLCMCPQDLSKKINKKSKVVIYTEMNGRVGQIDKIRKICKKNNLFLIEDSAHSIGSYNKKIHTGNSGIAGSFSFSMPKLITMGQGGAVITNNKKLEKNLRLYKNFGRSKSGTDIHNHIGYNFKITDLQAVIGLGQLVDIEKRIIIKKKIFERYKKNLKDNKRIKIFQVSSNETPWSVDIYLNDPKKLKKKLEKIKIHTRLVYPPLNSQKIYKKIKGLPISNYFCNRGLWLPSSLDISNKEIDYICKKINKIIK